MAMNRMTTRRSVPAPLLTAALAVAWAAGAAAQSDYSNPNMTPVNDLPNPYSRKQIMPLPDGRTWGSTAGVDAAKGHDDIWAIDRCGSNTCVGSHVDPLLHYDASGKLIGHMGADLFAFPHGIHVDQRGQHLGHRSAAARRPRRGRRRGAAGHRSSAPTVEILLQIGTRKVSGNGPNEFSSPSDVVIGRNGDIFVADGHGEGTNERIMKFDRRREIRHAVGQAGNGPCGAGEFSSLHALAIDSEGRLFIADRDNNRIQIYDQDGNYLDCWYQFSRPSGIYIDADDNMFVGDSESRDGAERGHGPVPPGMAARHSNRQREGRLREVLHPGSRSARAAAARPRASRRSRAGRWCTAPRWVRETSFGTT